MSRVIPAVTPNKILPKLVALGPYEVYLNQVKSSLEAIRYQNKDMEYLPPQLGGLTGQRKIIKDSLVLQMIDFEVN
jgi:hypothetical protein